MREAASRLVSSAMLRRDRLMKYDCESENVTQFCLLLMLYNLII